MELWTPVASDEQAVAALLRAYDPELRLVPQPSDTDGVLVWQVRRTQGNDRPSDLVCVWADQAGRPLPLSSSLLDLVKELDRNTRSLRLDADVRNELKRQAEQRQWDRDMDALVSDWETPHGRPVLPRGVGLRMARDKRRAQGEKC